MLIDKPAGLTSHDVVSRVRRALNVRRVGHTGTLDPFATGLLVVLVGSATRIARFVPGDQKQYVATARLGARTDTDDLTGEVVSGCERAVSSDALRSALEQLVGEQWQVPPSYSAKHVAGERSHRLARRGATVQLEPRQCVVHELRLIAHDGCDVDFECTVSAGTYIRALARDLGELLGTGAHLRQLRRTAIGDLTIGEAVALEDFEHAPSTRPALEVLRGMAVQALDDAETVSIRHGRDVEMRVAGPAVALSHRSRLVAIAEPQDGVLHPVVVLDAA